MNEPPAHPPPEEVQIGTHTFVLSLAASELEARSAALAADLNQRHADPPPVLMPVLSGAYRFFAALLPHLHIPYEVSFCKLASYFSGMQSSGSVLPQLPPGFPLKDRHVIILEDIIDTGRTVDALSRILREEQAARVEVATLLFKPEAFTGQQPPDWIGFRIPNAFVVGFGLDFDEQGRHLPGIYTLQQQNSIQTATDSPSERPAPR